MELRMEPGPFDDFEQIGAAMETFGDSFDDLFPEDAHNDEDKVSRQDWGRISQSEENLKFMGNEQQESPTKALANQKHKTFIPMSPSSLLYIQTTHTPTSLSGSATPLRTLHKCESNGKYRTLKDVGENVVTATYIPANCSPRKMRQNNSDLALNEEHDNTNARETEFGDEGVLRKISSVSIGVGTNIGTPHRSANGIPLAGTPHRSSASRPPHAMPIRSPAPGMLQTMATSEISLTSPPVGMTRSKGSNNIQVPSPSGMVRNGASAELGTQSPRMVRNLAVTEILSSSYSSSFKVVKLENAEMTRGYFASKRKSYMSNLCAIVEDETVEDSE